MRIYDLNLTGTSAAETGRAQGTQQPDRAGSSTAAQNTGKSGDHVELSSTLGRLSRAIASHESSRANRVQALSAQYQAGKYQPDAHASSRGMVAEALAMGGN